MIKASGKKATLTEMSHYINAELEKIRWAPIDLFAIKRDTRIDYLNESPRAKTER